MKAVTSQRNQARLSLAVDVADLQPGRAYRLEVVGYRAEDAADPPFAQIRIAWDAAGEGGDEYFPFPRRDGTWRAPVLNGANSGHIEFRAPERGTIQFTGMRRTGSKRDPSGYKLRLEPTAPVVPVQMLQPIPDIVGAAQDRCELLDLREWTGNLVPLPCSRANRWQTRRSQPKPRGQPSIAFIGSSELLAELGSDCDAVAVDEHNWTHVLRKDRLDYLLIEPVLHVDQSSWCYAMTRNGDRRPMQALLRHCREIGLPVVLWLRLEAEIYEEFSWLVPLVDRVYAVDQVIQRMVAAQHPEADARVLAPCVQPRLHNPACNRSVTALKPGLADKVLLDGWWRLASATRDRIIGALHRDRLLVSESEWEFSFTRLNTLRDFRWNTIGCLDQVEKALLSKLVGAELFLLDETLPSWRREQMMLRSAAGGSVVLFRNEGTRSSLIDEGLCWHGDDETLLGALPALVDSPLERARWQHRVVREVLERHTYRARLSTIARDLGLGPEPPRPPRVACLLVSMRPWLLESCIERFKRDLYPEKELIIVVHGSPATARELAVRSAGDDRIQIHQLSKARSLGACLNFAAQQTDAPFWAKFDDDDLYGPRYLSDMMLYQQIADSDLLAKPPAFIYLEGEDELRWHAQRASHAWMHHPTAGGEATAGIVGGTLVGKRSLLQEIPFSELRRGGSDSDFVLRARKAGHDLLVTDPFNFAFFRSSRAGFHTWNTDFDNLRKKSVHVGNSATLDSAVFI